MSDKIIISPLASILGIPHGAVPDHGFTTWIGPDIAGLRAVVSILWHDSQYVELKESVIDVQTGNVVFGRATIVLPEQALLLLYYHTTIVPDFVFIGPFTAKDPLDHVQWLASHGIRLPEDNPHWVIPCREPQKTKNAMPDVIGKLLNSQPTSEAAPTPISAPNDLASIVTKVKGETSDQVKFPLEIKEGEKPWVNVRQSRPNNGRVIEFFSKVCVDQSVECIFVEKDLSTGQVTELYRDKLQQGQVDAVLKQTAQQLFKNGETWVPIDL